MRNYVMTEEHPTVRDHYYLLKDLYTVAGLAGSNGALEEAYVYDTYGYPRIYQWSYADIDRDGDFDQQTDQAWVANHYSPFLGSGTDARSDVDMNGVINAADESKMLADPNGGVPVLITHSGLGNPYFFTGRPSDTWHAGNPSDPDDITVAGDPDGFRRMQDNRNRMYDPKHGRWLQRDPLLYVDGTNLYQYAKATPGISLDPFGLRDWVDHSADFVAGVGDALSMGLTQQVRKGLDWLTGDGYQDSWTHTHGKYYIAGEVTEVVVEIGVTFGGASLRHVARNTVRTTIEGGARGTFRRRVLGGLQGGIISHYNPIIGHPGGRLARYPLPFRRTARGTWNMHHIPRLPGEVSDAGALARHLAEHRYLMRLEALDRVRQSTMLVRQAGNAVLQHVVSNGACTPNVSVAAGLYGEVDVYFDDIPYDDDYEYPGYPDPFSPPVSIDAYEQWVEAGNVYIVP